MAWAQIAASASDDESPISQAALLDVIRKNFDASRVYLTRAAIEAADAPSEDHDTALVLGNLAAGDGGHGLYYWDDSSTTTPDGVTIIQPDSEPATGRWLLLPSVGAIHAEITKTDEDTTPTVRGQDRLTINYSTQAVITGFDDAVDGQKVRVWFNNNNPRIQKSSSMVTIDDGDIVFNSTGGFTVLEYRDGVWYEHYRVNFPSFDQAGEIDTTNFTPTTTQFECVVLNGSQELNGPAAFYIGKQVTLATPNGPEQSIVTAYSVISDKSHITVLPAFTAPPNSTGIVVFT